VSSDDSTPKPTKKSRTIKNDSLDCLLAHFQEESGKESGLKEKELKLREEELKLQRERFEMERVERRMQMSVVSQQLELITKLSQRFQ
jgi:hypothetical protein